MDNQYLLDAVKVCEVASDTDANRFLSVGWKLIGVYQTMSEHCTAGVVYSLGWFDQSKKPVKPVSPNDELSWSA